ncbi:MAG TPA: LLM class flavin-dependent oxidoreductase [Acidimicrobiales bacterium]|nr:LLM class flavin-dependent oxidoreductase [Acidimicrobiales bacterium]
MSTGRVSLPSLVKVRIGVGGVVHPESVNSTVNAMEELGFDSLWLSEVLTAPVLDPLVGLAFAAASNPRLKLGTTMLLPGRNPIRLAKALASLDALSGGRLLITFVPGLTTTPEREAIGLKPGERGAAFDETLPLLRRLWAGEPCDGVVLAPLPYQQPLEAWLGGMAPAALERCGRLGDGWLPSLCTPDEAAQGKRMIDEAADRAGRTISPEHFGVSVGYAREPLSDQAAAAIAARSRGHDPRDLVPVGLGHLHDHLERFIAIGFSKFVVRPLAPPASWRDELEDLAAAVGVLQS